MGSTKTEERWLSGGCHCGALRFEVRVDRWAGVLCNCSICEMSGFQHCLVPADAFRLQDGAANITTYRFNTGAAKHTFCRTCGVKPFYTPRSHPHGMSVNIRCLDDPDARARFELQPFDGRHWEKHIGEIR